MQSWAQSRSLPAGCVFRAQLILALGEGRTYREIECSLGASAPTVSKWKRASRNWGVKGLQGPAPTQQAMAIDWERFERLVGVAKNIIHSTRSYQRVPGTIASPNLVCLCLSCGSYDCLRLFLPQIEPCGLRRYRSNGRVWPTSRGRDCRSLRARFQTEVNTPRAITSRSILENQIST